MDCPKCGHPKSKVHDTGTHPHWNVRERRCLSCRHWWRTVELPIASGSTRYRNHWQKIGVFLSVALEADGWLRRIATQLVEGHSRPGQ